MVNDEARRGRWRARREAIAAAAMGLFAEHGFDAVTVAQVAAAAGVAEKTVFNYFPTKAELFFDEGEDLLAELLLTVGQRPDGQTALAAVARFVTELGEWTAHRRPVRPGREFRALIAASPALQAHRRAMFARYETELATLLARDTGAAAGAVEPFLAAVALIGVLRAAFEAAASDPAAQRADLDRGLALLAHGLGNYAPASAR